MQFPRQGKPPVGVIFDCDMGARIDTALALALLYGFDGKNEVRVISLSVSRNSLTSAAYTEAIGKFYAGAVSGAFGGAPRTLPVGMNDTGPAAPDTPMLTVPLARQTPDGKPFYDRGIHKLNDTAEPVALIRNALTSQYDQNAIALLAGPATNLVKILDLPGVSELIARKVRFLSVVAGAYPNGPADPYVKADIRAAKRLFAEWPTPIVAAGAETGAALLYPGESIERDFAWSPAHPVVDAYRAYRTMPYDAPSWDMTAVLYAARPQEGYFKLSDPGTLRALDDGRVKFTPSAGGKHRYLILDPEQKERIIKTYTEVASAKPVVRQFRFRKKDQPDKDAKPEATPAKPSEPKP
jgi:inosine-uridine nucleoside N-ribohydrolase